MYYQDPFIDSDQTEKRIGHPILTIVEQHKSHPSIIAINNQYVIDNSHFKKLQNQKQTRKF